VSKDRWLMSVCTGSLILAAAGVLDGMEATTHHSRRDLLAEVGGGKVKVVEKRVVVSRKAEEGTTGCTIITSGGVTSGIDAALFLVKTLFSEDIASKTAAWIEYDWKPQGVGLD